MASKKKATAAKKTTAKKTTAKKTTAKKKAAPVRDFSDEIRVPLFGKKLMFFFENADEEAPEVLAAIENLFRAKPSVLEAATKHLVAYRQDGDDAPKELASPKAVWKEVHFGHELYVTQREDGDKEDGVYFSLECNCDWEREHGLQIVIRDGLAVSKIGPFDDHLTNADAYDDRKLVGVVYKQRKRRR